MVVGEMIAVQKVIFLHLQFPNYKNIKDLNSLENYVEIYAH